MTRYAIGDIQGCQASLDRLLEKLAYSRSRDTLWLTGDLVNRGPRSLDVLRWAIEQGSAVQTVLGNHDLHLLARVAGAAGEKKRDTLDDVLNAPDRARLIDWLRAQPVAFTADHFILIHAGLHPTWSVETARALATELEHELAGPGWKAFMANTSGGKAPDWDPALTGVDRWRAALSYFVRARMLNATTAAIVSDFDGGPKAAPPGTTPWFAMAAKWTRSVALFGHWAALGLDVGPQHIGLDTGCVWGKALTAVRLDDRAIVQVAAVEPPR
ncbi:symmetrical bis(5'-nucleosyl)-tetraphosphatase [soil metagenome]